jgi:dTDP-glucose pyrophosphorylase
VELVDLVQPALYNIMSTLPHINVVIPAAGAATRLRPLSNNMSKIMVRVNGKPCLDYIIDEIKKHAIIKQLVIVDGQFDDIREYCQRRYPSTTFVKQTILNGPRDACTLGINAITNNDLPLVIWLGDAIIIEDQLPLGTDFLLTKVVNDHHNWCMWNPERQGDADEFVNKPKTTLEGAYRALVGVYSFADGGAASDAFNDVEGYDISNALSVYYVNDYASVQTDNWYDIGDLKNYYETCAQLLRLKSRSFNRLEYDSSLGTIHKKPDYLNEHAVSAISGEIEWYNSLSPVQRLFVPQHISTSSELILSYEAGTLLSDLMLYENLNESVWEYIIDKIFRIKLQYFNDKPDNINFVKDFHKEAKSVWIDKTDIRLNSSGLTEWTTVRIFAKAQRIYKDLKPIRSMHGDLHFGNIIYNFHTDKVKLIDPRGIYGSYAGSYGDDIYDWAKLAHDLYHGYNALVADLPHSEMIKRIFVNKLKQYNLPVDTIVDGGLVLLASCIPLHDDDHRRQRRFIQYVENEIKDKLGN